MRDPKRITYLLTLLEDHWQEYPDLRLSQLVINFAREAGQDAFYIEDEVLIEMLEKKKQVSP